MMSLLTASSEQYVTLIPLQTELAHSANDLALIGEEIYFFAIKLLYTLFLQFLPHNRLHLYRDLSKKIPIDFKGCKSNVI